MTEIKARFVVLTAAALVGAVAVPLAVAKKGGDDPAGHVRHANKKAERQHTAKAKPHRGKTTARAHTRREAEPNDDRGQVAEPSDDRGQAVEPGDDRGQDAEVQAGDDRGQDAQAETGDDRGGRGNDDGSGHQ